MKISITAEGSNPDESGGWQDIFTKEWKRLRMEAARVLVLNSSLPLKSIAERCGLANEFHLSRDFHRHFNVTASQMRKERNRLGHLVLRHRLGGDPNS